MAPAAHPGLARSMRADPRLTVRQLRRLVAVADHGSISAAAAALFLAQPALSKSLLELERNIGTRLFDRTNRGTVLSKDGTRAVRLARTILADVHAFEALARDVVDEPAPGGPLRIAATPSLANDLGTHLIPTFLADCPDFPVRLIRSPVRDGLFAAVRDGEADVGVAAMPVPPDLSAHVFATRRLVLVSPAHVDLPDPFGSGDLHGLPLVLPPPGLGRREEIDRFFAAEGVAPVVAMEAEERSAWIACVRAGLGSAFLWHDLHEHLGHPGTVVRELAPPIDGRVAVFHRPDAPAEAIRAFIAHAHVRGLRPGPSNAPEPPPA